jgi:hypothetical protein
VGEGGFWAPFGRRGEEIDLRDAVLRGEGRRSDGMVRDDDRWVKSGVRVPVLGP